eukprot:TRINITY_DN23000_c0_g1_i1.p1 TRINITY_DN23000_c0_g1~~TRINITY_DN23000_c0_g1_i1.p1  ORF type:complete len:527 (+),score=100.23 TRINITY_DN23000_c0_g1_i1:227-1807(+)
MKKGLSALFRIVDGKRPIQTPLASCKSFCAASTATIVPSDSTNIVNKRLRTKKKGIDNSKDNRVLYRRITDLGDQNESAVAVMKEWLREGRHLPKATVTKIIRRLRRYGRYKHALEVSEWMDRKRRFTLGKFEFGIRLDLIAKVHGIASAEKYFKDLPNKGKNCYTYAALLNSYVTEGMTEEAEKLMERMKELKYITNAIPYNNMMTLYLKGGQSEKVPALIEDMKANNIMPDLFTYNIWMQTAASLSGTKAVDTVFDELKQDSSVEENWTTYSNLATIYVKAGDVAKAETMLIQMEKKLSSKNLLPYNFLLTMYARLGKTEEVHRVWKSVRQRFQKRTSISYMCLLTSLVKLGDIKGAEKYFKDYMSENRHCDFRVPDILIEVYIKEGNINKASNFLRTAVEKGGNPTFKTWNTFLGGYLAKNKMNLAIETMEKALSKAKLPKWKVDPEKVQAILQHFEKSSDIVGAEEMFRKLRDADHINVDTYNSLIRTYIQCHKDPSTVIERMRLDKIDPNSETGSLIKRLS